MSSPKKGEYISQNGEIKITITETNISNGEIQGSYYHAHTPNEEGELKVEGEIGQFRWVDNNAGGSGTAPYSIFFTIKKRPEDYRYSIVEIWNGYCTEKNTMVLSGTQSYVDNKGINTSIDFGTIEFALKVLATQNA